MKRLALCVVTSLSPRADSLLWLPGLTSSKTQAGGAHGLAGGLGGREGLTRDGTGVPGNDPGIEMTHGLADSHE